jgi:hypothetical protein
MSQPCAAQKCSRASRGLCDCCTQHLCIQHLTEHNAALISQLNPLADEINALGDRLKSFNIHIATSDCGRKLEQWRKHCHEKIDTFFKQKQQQLNQLADEKIKKEEGEIDRIRLKVAKLIREQETTRRDIDSLTSTIRQLQTNMDNIEQTCLTISIRPLQIDDTIVVFKETSGIDLSTLSPVCKTINRFKSSSYSLTSNDRFLLMHQRPNLCFVDREMNIVKQMPWVYDSINGMCWSSILNQFIVIGGEQIVRVDDNTMTMENIQMTKKYNWLSCTCSDKFLFLSTDGLASNIMKFKLLPSIELVEEWKSPQICARDEIIHIIVYNNEKLAMMITNKSKKSLRIELRYAETFDRIWSLSLDTVVNQDWVFRCCVLTCDEWLVTDHETQCLLQITKDGKLKHTIPYDTTPCCANLFANMLVVRKAGGVNFHKL